MGTILPNFLLTPLTLAIIFYGSLRIISVDTFGNLNNQNKQKKVAKSNNFCTFSEKRGYHKIRLKKTIDIYHPFCLLDSQFIFSLLV